MTDKSVIHCVVGARPNFVKMAPALQALRSHADLSVRLIHTGQHYDPNMNDVFFEEMRIPKPDYHLEVRSGTHAEQTARVMQRIEPVLATERPDILIVAGDVNSTLASALVAAKLMIPVAHIEAGLRSNDRRMPEEINRILVDQISDILYTTERDAARNLTREGISSGKIEFVGNLMIDTLMASLGRATPGLELIKHRFGSEVAARARQGYALLTLHRPSNVDNTAVLQGILTAVSKIAQQIPVIFPAHPRTQARIAALGEDRPEGADRLLTIPPLSYLDMLGLTKASKLVLTDSGGIQEETTALGIPCLTLRENTERPITVLQGTNTIVGTSPEVILREAHKVLSGQVRPAQIPEGWDGAAATRMATHLSLWLRMRNASH